MPMLIRTIDEIIAREKRDMLFVQFDRLASRDMLLSPERQRHLERHVEWFKEKGLAYEAAAPRGWLGGDPGILAVYFDGSADPRVAEYAAEFEDASGKSLAPEHYQMVIVPYEAWEQAQCRPRP